MGTQNNILPLPSKESHDTKKAIKAWLSRHEILLEILLDAWCVVDLDNQVVEFNVAFEQLFGITYRKIKKKGDIALLILTELDESPTETAIRTQKPVRLDEVRASTDKFEKLELIIGTIPIFDESNAIIGALTTIRDVTAESALQKKYDKSKKESVIDGLTGLFNKKYAQQAIIRMVRQSTRLNHPLSVVMGDIDFFKKVNDNYGHQAGDFVLTQVAKLLKDSARDSDVTGRFGGEEFVAILPNSSPDGARIFCERYRKRVEGHEFVFEGTKIPVTTSLGSATIMPPDPELSKKYGKEAEAIAKEIVARADIALYFSKGNGRNQSTQFESLPEEKKNGK